MRLTRGGWTLHEMIISLAVTGMIVTLAASAALGQLRFFRGIGEVTALRAQVAQAVTIAASVLREVGTPLDIHAAADSAIEASVTIGSAVACATDTGRITVPMPAPDGNTLAAFSDAPRAGDDMHVLVEDSAAVGWMAMRLAAVVPAATCGAFAAHGAAQTLLTVEPFVIAAGSPVRVTRRTRISLYRASDGQWYLGLKEWNGELQRFNTVQPVAGPLRPYSADPARSGFRFEYREPSGTLLAPPVEPAAVAVIGVVARGLTVHPARIPGMSSAEEPFRADSAATAVALRHR